ncbi:uncharacterized protein alms1 isoform X2 [Betta splendens]|uniref:Uncharacterized protein alms1 isoform X2 n=1 Tax=Betta splendens TaxID=158456 RepID=A0A6P7LI80_BETSP|nr:uncharacterized protein alms1 isoform X2 [Betta splendens]
MATFPQPPADGGESHSVGQTPRNQAGAQSQHSVGHDWRQPRTVTGGSELQRPGGHSLHLEFQDSNLSPALSLLPSVSVEHNFTEYSLFHQSDNEFAPLRAYPDVSTASEMFHFPPHDQSTQASEHESLSQHPLAQASIFSEEGASCFVSQDSLSPQDEAKQVKNAHSDLIPVDNREAAGSLVGEPPEDELFFLRKDVSVKQLLGRLQEDVGMLSSSSAVSSDSGNSMKSITYLDEGPKKNNHRMIEREGPPGEASLPQQQTQQPNILTKPEQSQALSSEVCNITMGSRSTQPDDSTQQLHRELVSEAGRRCAHETVSKNLQQQSPSLPGQSLTPNPTETPEDKLGVRRINQPVPGTGPFSTGITQTHREQDLWFSGNQTGIDGSFLGFLPQSQSTPGVFKWPPKSTDKAQLGQLSDVQSSEDNSCQTNTGISPQPAVPVPAATLCQEEATTAEVQSLPSLNYMQKVDAWRANQSSGKTSLFDSLALQGFSGVSPKKKAYDAVSDTLNHILTQHVKNLQPPVSSAAKQTVTQSSPAPSGASSPTRGEAVGSAPNDRELSKSGARPSSSPFGRSQSHSSLSTVVMLVQRDQHTDRPAENKMLDEQQISRTVQPSPLMSLGHFSDVSVDKDVALSSSQDSYNSGIKLATSVGASSVTSLDVDNYAPYWTSKLSTPPPRARARELNIEERIPLYLHNLGIDQSPSAILTPFVPRGPIREPEFSPTDLCTIKGSVGTPSKSTQPSEGGSPHKGEFSRSSILSVDSSVSIPLSLDSLGAAVLLPEQIQGSCTSSDTETQSQRRLASSSQSDDECKASQQQEDCSLTSSQNTEQTAGGFDSKASDVKGHVVSPMQPNRHLDQSADDSFVSSKALWEIRKLLSQAENVVSAATSAASSASAALPRLLSDSNVFLSTNKKATGLQNSFLSASSSSAAEDTRNWSSFLGARSSSDSMLISERPRQSSVGGDRVATSWQPVYPSTQALAAEREPQDGTADSSALSKSARRAEPEGCSAAPPAQPPVVKPLPSVSTEGPEEEKASVGGSAGSDSSSPILGDMDQGAGSDGSSESSLAVRVAKLLRSDSPATMVSSTTSSTDQEENKAREWIRQTVSGQQCQSLELNKEDRERIEEIKRELLLKKPVKSQGSTDTESSASSSLQAPMSEGQCQQTELSALRDTNLTRPGLSTDLLGPSVQPMNSPCPDLEAQVREIAAREGVALPKTKPLAITSITIATRRRSTSPSSPTSPAPPFSPAPEPLHLAELSTGAVDQPQANWELPPTQDEYQETSQRRFTQNQTLTSGYQERQNTFGGQFEECPLPLKDLDREDLNVHKRFVSDGLGAEQSAVSTTSESPAKTGHISHVHLTLSPKDHSLNFAPSSDAADVTRLQRQESVPLRHVPSDPSSPDEGVGLSSPPEWFDSTKPKGQRGTAHLFKAVVTQERSISTSTQHRPEVSPKNVTTESPAVPVLLPYKPRGSEELFYVPQTDAGVFSTDASDTTMESSHTGSDDAVPPRFSSEVLGHQDPGLDRGVNIRHTEGIYSKRLRMQREHTDKCSQTDFGQTSAAPSRVSVAFTRLPSSSQQEGTKRDQGTSPVQFPSYEPSRRDFQPVLVDVVHDRGRRKTQRSVPEAGRERDQQRRDPDVSQSTSQQTGSNLDQLWQRFCDRWTLEEARPTRDREASLLERLERLSRLINSTRAADGSEQQQKEYSASYSTRQKLEKQRGDAAKKERRRSDTRETERNLRGSRGAEDAHVWTRTLQEEEEEDSHASSLSHSSLHSQHLCPADKDETETLSTTSSSMSTIDTARLIRAFGAHRVQHLKSSSSLSKLYSAINRQKDGREQRRGRNPDSIVIQSENTVTDESVAADSASSYSLPSHHGLSRSLAAKRSVRLVNKGIQAGDLEIVSNGTRRHTRDVGTTFPSPRESGAARTISSSSYSMERGRGGKRSPSKSQTLQQRKSKRSSSKRYPQGVSWFISADNLSSDAKKENQPEESTWRPSTAWFELYSRRHPWREPLRQRQVHEDRNQQPSSIHDTETDPEPRTKTTSSGLARVSLQEALEMRRPEFISRSRQRVRRLALQVEERRLESVFLRERDEYQPTGRRRLPKPAGTGFLRRAVPRKEMIQRSKQIYENLPEVQRRKEEERRKAEYRSYRLNAQLYNKRITSRVLGRTAWQ